MEARANPSLSSDDTTTPHQSGREPDSTRVRQPATAEHDHRSGTDSAGLTGASPSADRVAAVLDLLEGASPAVVAARHGVSPEELLTWRDLYLKGARDTGRWSGAPRRWKGPLAAFVGCALAAGLLLTNNQAMSQVCGPALPAPLTLFCPGEPARAAAVNGNFRQLVDWAEQKTGAVGSADVTMTGLVDVTNPEDAALDNSGALTVGATSGSNLTFDNNEILARNAGSSATLFIQGSGTNGNTILNRDGGRVGIGEAAPAEQLHVGGNTRIDGALNVQGETHFSTGMGAIVGGGTTRCTGNSQTALACSQWGAGQCTTANSCGARFACPAGTTRQTLISGVECYANGSWGRACQMHICTQ